MTPMLRVARMAVFAASEVGGGAVIPLAERLLKSSQPADKQTNAVKQAWSEYDDTEKKSYLDKWCLNFAVSSFTTTLMFPEDEELEDDLSNDFL